MIDSKLQRIIQRIERRKRQRGAAVFVVVLVISLITGVGIYAVRSAGIAVAASGHNRTLTQAHYISEYAILSAVASSSGNPEAVKVQMLAGPQAGEATCVTYAAQTNPTCWLRSFDDFDTQITAIQATNELIEAPNVGSNLPGSFGYANVDADMRVEFTDLHPAQPVKGFEAGGGRDSGTKLVMVYVTLTASGLVRPMQAAAGTWDTKSMTAAAEQSSRAHLFLGPVNMQVK